MSRMRLSDRARQRRAFLQTLAAAGLGAGLLAKGVAWAAEAKPRLKKAVKYGMIKVPGASIEEKFNLIKSLGFEGVEIDSPSDVDRAEAVAARDKTGIKIHGVIDSVHWQIRLSDPDADVRAKGVAALRGAVEDAKLYGADTVLLVPGKVTNAETENYDQCYTRSQAEIRKVIPQATDAGVKIAIEVVWNDFITKPEQLVQYVDDFQDADRRRLFRLQQHAQVRRAGGHLDSPARQADAQVRFQGLQPRQEMGGDRRRRRRLARSAQGA